MTNCNSRFYTYRVTWSKEDEEHVGLCAEFPSLSYLNKDISQALKGITKLVSKAIKDMEKNNEEVPEPISTKKYSGKFIIRIPPQEHRELVIKAAEEGVSLNRYAISPMYGRMIRQQRYPSSHLFCSYFE